MFINSIIVFFSPSPSSSSSSSSNKNLTFSTLRGRASCEREIKRSKFTGIAAPILDEESAFSFLAEVRDPRATHNCWAYKLGDQFRYNDDGEPAGTAGRPIYSGIDRLIVVVTRYFGGIKLGTGGLVRAYAGVASECLRDAVTCVIKSKVQIMLEIPYDSLGSMYHQLQKFEIKDINQDTDVSKDGFAVMTFKVDFDKVEALETSINEAFSGQVTICRC